MLKRITVLVILLVLIKPAYDTGKKVLNEVNSFLNESDAVITDVSTEALSTIQEGTSKLQENLSTTLSTVAPVGNAPNSVKSTEELADAFYYYFSKWQTDFEIHYVGSTTDIENIISKAVDDASKRNHYIQGHLSDRKIEYEYGRMDAKIKVQQQYLTNAEQEKYVDAQVAAIVANVPKETMSDFDKVKFVNDYIVKNTEYSTESIISPHSACAVIKEGKGVCQGYALLALKMLQAFGVETQYVVGEVYTGGHAWNLVKVDGEWYHLDTTWNDPVPDRGNVVRYQYFLVNDTTMKLDHSWDSSAYPKATNKKYAFMSSVDHAYEVNGTIFYSNVNDNHYLYTMNLKTGENVPFIKKRAQYIVGYGDWLYFSDYSNGAYLTKIKIDGTEQSTLYKDKVSDLFVEDGYLFFTTDDGMRKMEI